MRRDDVLRVLAEHRAELAEQGVKSLAVFGSVARDEARPDSDVDILVEFDQPIGLFAFVGVQEQIETILDCRVDLVMPDALHPALRDEILAEAVYAA